jgi:hypothetical protein
MGRTIKGKDQEIPAKGNADKKFGDKTYHCKIYGIHGAPPPRHQRPCGDGDGRFGHQNLGQDDQQRQARGCGHQNRDDADGVRGEVVAAEIAATVPNAASFP